MIDKQRLGPGRNSFKAILSTSYMRTKATSKLLLYHFPSGVLRRMQVVHIAAKMMRRNMYLARDAPGTRKGASLLVEMEDRRGFSAVEVWKSIRGLNPS